MSTPQSRRPLPTNAIVRARLDLRAAEAEIAALRDALESIRDYVQSEKFCQPGDLQGYVGTGDIVLRVREAEAVGHEAGHQVYEAAQIPDCQFAGVYLPQSERWRVTRASGEYSGGEAPCPACCRRLPIGPDLRYPSHTETAAGDLALARAIGKEAA